MGVVAYLDKVIELYEKGDTTAYHQLFQLLFYTKSADNLWRLYDRLRAAQVHGVVDNTLKADLMKLREAKWPNFTQADVDAYMQETYGWITSDEATHQLWRNRADMDYWMRLKEVVGEELKVLTIEDHYPIAE